MAYALEEGGGSAADGQPWTLDNVAVWRAKAPRTAFSLSRTQTWANGLAPSRIPAFTPSTIDKTVGAKMQPFQDWNLLIGTELIRSGGQSGLLSSKSMWESSWSQDLEEYGRLRVGFSTTGSLDNRQADYFQSFSGSLNVPLDLPLSAWNLELRLSPTMNVDVSHGSLSSNLISELVGQTVLSAQDAAFRSTLDLSVGYSFAPDTRPAASARLQLTISPKL
ncbi:hypothetical protein [Microvirga makkahensis]|uniref:Autotransporter domain-containing protein n=1 Tax=Microvirga makkahensis TaxID=1128670 RepID=A0A7X3MQR6_9HYPH|nr:hypothetical protein [Microvirga makkahensis]MXQ11323.1 hypothetical protein [Microvirga makkahensis]